MGIKRLHAVCHPDLPHFGRGFCKNCYRLRNRRGYIEGIDDSETYESLLSKQGGVCLICLKPPGSKRKFHVDHDHKTNKYRGLLCHKCNVGLGHFDDEVNTLEKAIKYLKDNSMSDM